MRSHPSITSPLHVPPAPSPPQTWLMMMPMSMAQESSVLPGGTSAAFPASANVTRGIGGGFYGTVCHIGTAYQGSGFDVPEAEAARLRAEIGELFGREITPHGMMIAGRREVLPHGEDLHAGLPQVAGQ